MADLTQMIRWNANFVRGLAQSVLDRAKTIRTSLNPYGVEAAVAVKPATGKVTAAGRKVTVSKAAKKTKSAGKARKTKRTNA